MGHRPERRSGLRGGYAVSHAERRTTNIIGAALSLRISSCRPKQGPDRHARDAGITLAGTLVPAQDETKHFKLIGTTGTGKSTAIQEILSSALARGDRAVIADPDGGYLQRFYRPKRGDIVLNPFDKRSVKWDLFSEIKNAHDVEQLARSLIPDHDGQDRSWRGVRQDISSRQSRGRHMTRG